eukprot:XP_001706362.1 Hypothetical protein GL50803_34032 [Giardia lamblia ATCC 50803]
MASTRPSHRDLGTLIILIRSTAKIVSIIYNRLYNYFVDQFIIKG